jgi:predicted SAM-dependent methyltransferase
MRTKAVLQFVAWEIVNKSVLRWRGSGRRPFQEGLSGINLGCGLDSPPNWLGIDGGVYLLVKRMPRWLVKAIWPFFNLSSNCAFGEYLEAARSVNAIHYDMLRGLPFDDGTVPAVYSAHFFEHLSKSQTVELLRECHRVLKPGGIIRICVPSLDEEIQKIRKAIDAYERGDAEPIQPFVTQPLAGYVDGFSTHKHMYGFRELQRALADVGFSRISQRSRREGALTDAAQLDVRDGLFVEAVKRADPIRASVRTDDRSEVSIV